MKIIAEKVKLYIDIMALRMLLFKIYVVCISECKERKRRDVNKMPGISRISLIALYVDHTRSTTN
jgi:hypothetical protein